MKKLLNFCYSFNDAIIHDAEIKKASETTQEIFFKFDAQIIDADLEEQSNENKLKSVKFSTNLKELKAQLESKFNLFLEGPTSYISNVGVTSDNKYIVSGS